MRLNEVNFHDAVLCRVVEIPDRHLLSMELDYPIDWEAGVRAPMTLAFHDVLNYTVEEGPFAGRPTLLRYSVVAENARTRITIDTNAGRRSLSFSTLELTKGHSSDGGCTVSESGRRLLCGALFSAAACVVAFAWLVASGRGLLHWAMWAKESIGDSPVLLVCSAILVAALLLGPLSV